MRGFTTVLALSIASLVCACEATGPAPGGGNGTADPSGKADDSTDATSTLLAGPDGSDFTVQLQLLNGKAGTERENLRFTKVTVKRADKSFTAWCDVAVRNRGEQRLASVSCALGAATVSGDDDESLGFAIERVATAGTATYEVAQIVYTGDGTFLGDQADVLMGPARSDDDIPLTARREGTSALRDPFALAAFVDEALAPLVDRPAYSQELRASISIKGYAFSLSNAMDVTITLALSEESPSAVDITMDAISLLGTAGELASGLVDADTLAGRALEAIPQRP
jgi:hypothetical protein